jgi:hypothetical protein
LKQIWKIDGNNIFTGESYFTKVSDTNEITTPLTVGYVKPLWNGIEWQEGATEEEIQEWKESNEQQNQQPTLEERVSALEILELERMFSE